MGKRFLDMLVGDYEKELKKSFLFTYLWGMVAHGYMFMSNSLSHDFLGEYILQPQTAALKFGSGRIFAPVVQWLRGSISVPWWVGILSLFFMALALLLILRLFDIRKDWMICLTAGVLVVNVSYVALVATYIHDLDSDSLAVLMAVLAVYLWRTQSRGWLYGILPVILMLGLYQSILSVVIVLVILLCIQDLINGQPFQTVFSGGLRSIAMMACGGVLYFLLQKTVVSIALVDTSANYNALSNMFALTPVRFLQLVAETWFDTLFEIVTVVSGLPLRMGMLINAGIVLLCVAVLAEKVFSRSMGVREKILLVSLFLIMPVGANVSRVLFNGTSHDLMHYAIWLIYLLALVLTDTMVRQKAGRKNRGTQVIAGLLVAVTLFGNTQMANGVYAGKRFIQDSNLSMFTRIVSDIEDLDGYIVGQTQICFVGEPESAMLPLADRYNAYYMTGFESSYVVPSMNRDHYQSYFSNVLMNPGVIVDHSTRYQISIDPRVQAMPLYPSNGSIAMLDGVVVVKLGNN